jgi:hypothetical protein
MPTEGMPSKAGGVDGDDDEVGAGMEDGGDFAVEGRVAAFVVADALLVDPDVGAVVGCADVEEGAGAGLRGWASKSRWYQTTPS